MTDYAIIHITTPDTESADKIINALLDRKLVACAQTSSIESHYVWDGKVNHRPEISISLKAKKNDFDEIGSLILENHPYEVPEIIMSEISKGQPNYLDWIKENTK